MKKLHYIHFGMERTGTSWLYYNLIRHQKVDYTGDKELIWLKFRWDEEEGIEYDVYRYLGKYLDYFKDFDISFNFAIDEWKHQEEMLVHFDRFATHYGISFRNPYEMVYSRKNRFVCMHGNNPEIMANQDTDEQFINLLKETKYFDYTDTLKKLKTYCKKPFLVMVNDDLIKDQNNYYKQLLDHLNLEPQLNIEQQKVNARYYITDFPEFNTEQVSYINNQIDMFSDYMNRDFSHWKR